MSRVRNAYSTQPGNPLFGAVFKIATLRNQYTENGGKLKPRHRRFLARFIPPYLSDGSGAQRSFAILIPRKDADDMPSGLRAALRPFFERADGDWFAARPWIGNPDNAINPALIDNEMGTELAEDEEHQRWELEE